MAQNPFAIDFSALQQGLQSYMDIQHRNAQLAMQQQQHDRDLALREQEARQRAEEHAWNLRLKEADYESKIAEREERARLKREERSQAEGAARAIARASDLDLEQPMFLGAPASPEAHPKAISAMVGAGMGGMGGALQAAAGGLGSGALAGAPVQPVETDELAKFTEDSDAVREIRAALLSNRPDLAGQIAQAYQKRRATDVKRDLGVGRLDLDWFRARQKGELDWAALELRRKQWEARARRGGSGMGKDWPKYMAAGQAFVQRGQRAEALAQADFDDATKGFTMKDMLGNYTGVQRILSPEERQQKMLQAKAGLDEAKSFYDQSDEFFRAGTTRAGVGRVERPGKKSPGGAATAATGGVTAPAPAAPKRPPGVPANFKWNPQAQAWMP